MIVLLKKNEKINRKRKLFKEWASYSHILLESALFPYKITRSLQLYRKVQASVAITGLRK